MIVNGSIVKGFLPRRSQLEVGIVGLLLTVGVLTGVIKPGLTNDLNNSTPSQVISFAEAFGKETAISPRGKLPETDGVYLYSQSPEPKQVGQEYMVLEVNQNKVIGAFYMPQSEFSCFSGSLQAGKLGLVFANDPHSEPYSDLGNSQNTQQVATNSDRPVIGEGYNPIAYSYSVALQNYHQLGSLSAQDREILQTCKNNYQQ